MQKFDFEKSVNLNKKWQEKIEKTVKPLKEFSAITDFRYAFLYNNGPLKDRFINLTNNIGSMADFISTKKISNGEYFQHGIQEAYRKGSFILLWHLRRIAGINDEQMNHYESRDMGTGITLYFKTNIGIESFCFNGKNDDVALMEWFINNRSMLIRFGAYFKSKMDQEIEIYRKLLNNQKMLITPSLDEISKDQNKGESYDNFVKKISEIDNIRVFIPNLNHFDHLTARELDCLHGLYKGLSARQISEQHQLSIRTIQNYIDKIKQKLAVSSKTEILDFIKNCHDLLFLFSLFR